MYCNKSLSTFCCWVVFFPYFCNLLICYAIVTKCECFNAVVLNEAFIVKCKESNLVHFDNMKVVSFWSDQILLTHDIFLFQYTFYIVWIFQFFFNYWFNNSLCWFFFCSTLMNKFCFSNGRIELWEYQSFSHTFTIYWFVTR